MAAASGGRRRMLSRLQELRKEEETLLRVKAALHDQLTRLRVSGGGGTARGPPGGGWGRAGPVPPQRAGVGGVPDPRRAGAGARAAAGPGPPVSLPCYLLCFEA